MNDIVTPSSRREFLQKTTGAAAVLAAAQSLRTPVYGQNQAPSANVVGANNRLVCAVIGTGGQGFGAHVNPIVQYSAENNTTIAAVCDVSRNRRDRAKARAGEHCKAYEDYRQVLEHKDIDVVFVATVDHWHTPIGLAAMDSGKHVYIEKPMTRYLGEAFQLLDATRRTGKMIQVGSQGCSDMKWHKAAEWIRAGKIGPVVMSQGSYMRNSPTGEWNYTIQDWATADDINWEMWLGHQIKARRPFDADHYFRWRKYYPYCSGLLGDLFPHKLHPYMLATGNPEYPTRVACVGNKSVGTDLRATGNKATRYVRDVPEIVQLIAEFPSGMVMHITSSTVNNTGTQELIRGHKANLFMGGNRVDLKPEAPFASEEAEDYVAPELSEAFPSESVPAHQKNFFDSIRANRQPNAGIDLAAKVQTVISLAETSERLGVMCYFDEKTRKVTDGTGREIKPLWYGWDENS
jgi:predicted dehydrogenase